MIYRIVSFLIILSMFSCKHDLERTNPLDPNSPYYKPSSIQILAPNGGEEFVVGTSNTISWTSTKVDKINIELLKNDNIHDVLDSDIENTNSYVWDISSNTNVDTDYKVRITSSNNSEVYDESNSVFTITEDPQPGNITITSPTLNDNWLLGSSHDIVWNVTNITGTMSIELLKDGTFLKSIETATNSPYSWNIDTTNYSSGVNYTIRVVSNSDPSIDAESAIFELKAVPVSSIEILNLVSDSLEIGQTIDIEWNAINITGDVNILLYQNSSVVNTIAPSLAYNSSPYSWNIDSASYSAGTNYAIRVVSDNDIFIYDESDPFSIVDPPPPPNTSFAFFDDFSDQNIKIYPNINSNTSGIFPTSMNPSCWYNWVNPGAISGPDLLGHHVTSGSNFNHIRFDIENIMPSYSSVTGTSTDPLILDMDFTCILYDGGITNYDNFYQNSDLQGYYGFALYDVDQDISFIVYTESYNRELTFAIYDYSIGSHLLNPSPTIAFGSMASVTSIQLEYDGSSFKITVPNGNALTVNSIQQYYTNIDFETIEFIFAHNSAFGLVDADTHFDNVSLSGLKVPAKKGVKKNASFLRSNNRNIKIPFKK